MSRAAIRYAKAILDIAQTSGKAEAVNNDMKSIVAAIAESVELKEREALQKIANKNNQPLATTINGLRTQLRFVLNIATEALKEPTEPIKQINNCDGCQSNAPIKDGYHLDKDGKVYMTCQKSRYTTEKPLKPNQTEAEKEVEHTWDIIDGKIKCTCGANKEGGFKHISSDEALAKKLLEKVCPVLFKPSTDVKKAILAAMEEYASLARKQVIEEIEDWAKDLELTDKNDTIYVPEILTKLQTLKP